jgi:hypothetical protein
MNQKLLILITLCIIAGCLMGGHSYASPVKQNDGETIAIRADSVVPPGAPHAPVYNPFFATLESGFVLLGSSSYFGVVDVSLTSTAGDDYSTVFDTADGTIVIPISGSQGDYTLLITTASGLEFIGEFVL